MTWLTLLAFGIVVGFGSCGASGLIPREDFEFSEDVTLLVGFAFSLSSFFSDTTSVGFLWLLWSESFFPVEAVLSDLLSCVPNVELIDTFLAFSSWLSCFLSCVSEMKRPTPKHE